MIDYQKQYYILQSYDAIKSEVVNNEQMDLQLNDYTHKQSQIQKSIEQKIILDDCSTNPNIIFAIQSDDTLLQYLSSLKRQKPPMAYVLIEGKQHITFVIKIASSWPAVFIRIPINGVTNYAIQSDTCYEIPIIKLITKNIKIRNLQYKLILQKNVNIELVFTIYNMYDEKNIIISNIKAVDISALSELLKINTPNIKNNFSLQYTDNVIAEFNQMNIMIVREVKDLQNIICLNYKNNLNLISSSILLDDEKLIFTHKNNNEKEEIILCTKDSDSTVYWNITNPNKELLNIQLYENLFKLNYSKVITGKNKIFYVLSRYLNAYMFIKIISPIDLVLNKNMNYTFMEIFNNVYQIIECYMCTPLV